MIIRYKWNEASLLIMVGLKFKWSRHKLNGEGGNELNGEGGNELNGED